MTTSSPSDGRTIGAVERSFEIIGFLRESGPATVSAVAEGLDYSSSTAHIHLKTLEEIGYVVREGDGYALGFRFLRDGIVVQESTHLYHVAKPEVDRIAEETGEGVGLGVEENGQRVTLYNCRGSDSVHDNALIGEFTNMHWTALGKALLAHKDRSGIADVVDRYGLPEATDHTITDRERLFEEMEETRERGYAVENEERREGLRSIAFPIRVEETTVGAISITGPVNRMTDGRIADEFVDVLREAVNVVQVNYQYD